MKSLAKLFLRATIVYVLLTLIGITLTHIFFDVKTPLIEIITKEFIIIPIILLAFVAAQYLTIMEMKKHIEFNDSYDVYQSKTIHSKLSLEAIQNNLLSSDVFNKASALLSEDSLTIRTGIRGWSWGEKLTISLMKKGETNTYEVQSAPRFKLTVFDFGQGLKNVSEVSRLAEDYG